MELCGQERDAILAGLALLRAERAAGKVVIDKEDPETDPIGDLFSNGGQHDGLTETEIGTLADRIVEAYPAPPIR